MANEEKQALDPDDLDVESLDLDRPEEAAAENVNCYSCTCPDPFAIGGA